MLAAFCTRLAFGLAAALPLLSAQVMHPRFYRTHLLTALGLLVVAAVAHLGEPGRLVPLAVAAVAALFASVAWTLDPPPLGRTLLAVVLIAGGYATYQTAPGSTWDAVAEPFTAAAFLGSAVTAMLVGHSYLISPGLSIDPLKRMLLAVFVTLAMRFALAGVELAQRWAFEWSWPTEVVLWLPVRWLVGLVLPAVFTGMAYLTARIRSTQSATGILYVVVVCGFIGELIALLLKST